MAKRKQLSKKTRFEVFKRDAFKCQYCGRSAPDVILEVDHIVPVADGGKNDMINLITSCVECNRGKGARNLTDMTVIEKQKKQLDDLNAIREQSEMLIEWKRELMQIEETQVDAIEACIIAITGVGLSQTGRKNTRLYIKRFGFAEVYEATEIAFNRYKDWENAFGKIGGICYNRRKQRGELSDAEQDN